MQKSLSTLTIKAALVCAAALLAVACDRSPVDTGVKPPTTTVGTELDDTIITAGVKSALLADPAIKSLDFKVETRKGDVQVSGFVDNQMQIDSAIAAAKKVSGVQSVQNALRIKN